MRAIVPGSLDPVTNGHLDIIRRAAAIFDEVIVAVAVNTAKEPWFTLTERKELATAACAGLANVEVDSFEGLLVHYAAQRRAQVIVKGLRAVSDFESELQMAHTNRLLEPSVETLFVMTSTQFAYLSSRIVKELALLGGDITPFVPPVVVEPLRARAARRNGERDDTNP